MDKKVGDTIDYVDERGQPFKVRIVGAVANSILQGSLIIDEAEFVKRFPSESGYRMFLIDAPSNAVSQVSATLSRALQDVGLELTPAAQRLAQFNAVQNTYLGTFQVLGGLGLAARQRRAWASWCCATCWSGAANWRCCWRSDSAGRRCSELLLSENGALLVARAGARVSGGGGPSCPRCFRRRRSYRSHRWR